MFLWSRNLATFKRGFPSQERETHYHFCSALPPPFFIRLCKQKKCSSRFFYRPYIIIVVAQVVALVSCSDCVDRLLKLLTGIVPAPQHVGTVTASQRSRKEGRVKDLCGLLWQKQSKQRVKHHRRRCRLVSAKRKKKQKHFFLLSFLLFFSPSRHRHAPKSCDNSTQTPVTVVRRSKMRG